MNLTLHLVAKDVRYLRRALILWIILLVSQVMMSYRLVSNVTDDFDWFQRMSNQNDLLLLGLGLMVTYLLTGMLVLEDPVAGEKMFWVTRPIKGSRLLAGKVITALLLFGALPLVVRAPWWLLCDFSSTDMVVAALRLMGLQLLFAIPAFVVASLAANVGRFLIMSVLLAMGMFVALINLADVAGESHALRSSRELAAVVVLGVTGVIGTITMYQMRRIGRVMIILAIGVSLAGLARVKFPVNLSHIFARRTEIGLLENSSPITLEIDSARLDNLRSKEGSFENYLIVKIRVLNLPEELGLVAGQADVSLQWPDGTSVRSSSILTGSGVNDHLPLYRAFGLTGSGYRYPAHWDPETAAKNTRSHDEVIERSERLAHRGIPNYYWSAPDMAKGRAIWLLEQIAVSDEIAAKILKDPPECNMTIKVEASVPEVLGEITLVPGTVVTRHGRIELLKFTRGAKDSLGSQSGKGTFSILQGPAKPDQVVFCQIDRLHQTVDLINTNQAQTIAPLTEHLTWVGFEFTLPQVWRTDRWVEVPEWQKDFRIGFVVFKSAGTFNRSLQGGRLKLVTREQMNGFVPAAQAGHSAN